MAFSTQNSFTSPNNRGESHNIHDRISPMSNQDSNSRHSPPIIHQYHQHHHLSPNLNSQTTTRTQILQPPSGGPLPQTTSIASNTPTYIHSFSQGSYSYPSPSHHSHLPPQPPPSSQPLPQTIQTSTAAAIAYQQQQQHQHLQNQQNQQQLQQQLQNQQQQQQLQQQQQQHHHHQNTINNQRSFISNPQQSLQTIQIAHMNYSPVSYTQGPPVMIMPGVSHQIPQYTVPIPVPTPPPQLPPPQHPQHPTSSHPHYFQLPTSSQPPPSIQVPYGYPQMNNFQTTYPVHHPFPPHIAYTLQAPPNHGHHHPTTSLNSHHPHLDSNLISGHVPVAAGLGDIMLLQQPKTTNSG